MNFNQIHSIAVVANDYPSPGHPNLVFVQQLVEVWVDMGIRVVVIAPQSLTKILFRGQKIFERKVSNVTKSGNSYTVYRPFNVSFGNHLSIIHGLVQLIMNKQIGSIIDKENINIIYCHFWSSCLNVYKYVLCTKKHLYVACGEGDNALETMVDSMSLKSLQNLASAVTGVISVSTENKRKCISYGLAKSDKIGIFPNGVDTDLFKPCNASELKDKLKLKDSDFVIIFVGSFTPRKGPDRLAKAIDAINDDNIKVIFIGNTFPGYNYEFTCKGIVFKGAIDHDELHLYLNCSDVFVLPTFKEGCSNAIVEALASCIPVISSDAPFNEDILNSKNSILVNPRNIHELQSAIITLKEQKERREKIRSYLKSTRNIYSLNVRASNILTFMNNQIKNL